MPGFLHLFIISKSGGLIYNQDLSERAPKLNTNDWLRLGSTFHGLHAIAGNIAPVISSGIEKLETASMKLQCFQTMTGVKFVITAETGTPDLDVVLRLAYEAYADYALKNPFYELEMPIRCEKFSTAVDHIIRQATTTKSSSHRFRG